MTKKERPKVLAMLFAAITAAVVLLASTVMASETGQDNTVPNFYFADSAVVEDTVIRDNSVKELFFLFSSADVRIESDMPIYAFFSNITVDSAFTGDIYACFSKVTGSGRIHTFSSEVFGADADILPLIPTLSRVFAKTDYEYYADLIPLICFLIVLGVLNAAFCSIIYAIKRSFLEQGSVLILHEPLRMFNYGLSAYIILIALTLIFILSVVFMPVALVFLAALFALVVIGETSLALFTGYLISLRINCAFTSRNNLIAGLIVIESIKLIPFINIAFVFLILPILGSGTAAAAFVNGFINKTFYEIPYETEKKKKVFARKQIRDIILK